LRRTGGLLNDCSRADSLFFPLGFHVNGQLSFKHGKTTASFSTFTRLISQWADFFPCYKVDIREIFSSIPTVGRQTWEAVMQIDRLDHFVLTVRHIDVTIGFYQTVLGMAPVTFGAGRKALTFGQSKINLHEQGHELDPKASHPVPGSADLCFITATPLTAILEHLSSHGVTLVAGPVRRVGALGPIDSIYIRDPDGNLLELSNPVADA
jgi:catechol 2,3-dioxygenase-like lactoylglutathione lyase family enzyme